MVSEEQYLNLDSILPNEKSFISNSLGWKEKFTTKKKEDRITLYHAVTHFLAFIVILPFLAMVVLGFKVPEVYSTIVSVVIGFYFARSLFN